MDSPHTRILLVEDHLDTSEFLEVFWPNQNTKLRPRQRLTKLYRSQARRLMRQVSQTAACNAGHTAEERLSRWLLMCVDRVGGSELKLTQEFMAEMLGTRRATVSLAAMVLQDDGLIHYSRGHITIIDRAGLKDFTCECYEATRQF